MNFPPVVKQPVDISSFCSLFLLLLLLLLSLLIPLYIQTVMLVWSREHNMSTGQRAQAELGQAKVSRQQGFPDGFHQALETYIILHLRCGLKTQCMQADPSSKLQGNMSQLLILLICLFLGSCFAAFQSHRSLSVAYVWLSKSTISI